MTDHPTHLLTAEAAADANILFFKRAALFSMAKRESRIANFLLTTTLTELRRTQEHSLLLSRDAKCRVACFLIEFSKRMGTQTCLDLPMSHQDIADHLGLTIETISRVITQMENSGFDCARAVTSRPDIEQSPRTCAHDEMRCDLLRFGRAWTSSILQSGIEAPTR